MRNRIKNNNQKGAFGRPRNRIFQGQSLNNILCLKCAGCGTLLVKYDIAEGKILYKAEGLYEEGKDGNAVRLLCPIDKVWNKIIKGAGCVADGKDE